MYNHLFDLKSFWIPFSKELLKNIFREMFLSVVSVKMSPMMMSPMMMSPMMMSPMMMSSMMVSSMMPIIFMVSIMMRRWYHHRPIVISSMIEVVCVMN